MNWEITEVKALDFIKTSFDPAAYLVGGANSTKSDIFSPKYDCYIEVKDLSQGDVRLGQYTDSTKHQIFVFTLVRDFFFFLNKILFIGLKMTFIYKLLTRKEAVVEN